MSLQSLNPILFESQLNLALPQLLPQIGDISLRLFDLPLLLPYLVPLASVLLLANLNKLSQLTDRLLMLLIQPRQLLFIFPQNRFLGTELIEALTILLFKAVDLFVSLLLVSDFRLESRYLSLFVQKLKLQLLVVFAR